ncbi:hypothetical protein [Clostridium ihumii]|uniref:hypothetical protein n=1 Tax=Clostridium ihumii TaxID=1470356 RepID=UPI00058C2B46|nr:hypothetical protein [Clostridium ihumii]
MLVFIDAIRVLAFTLGVGSLIYSFLILFKKNSVIELNTFICFIIPLIITEFVVNDSYSLGYLIEMILMIFLMSLFCKDYVIYHPKDVELKDIITNVFNSHNIGYREFKNNNFFYLNLYLKGTLVTANINKNSLNFKSDLKFEKKDINEIILFINEYLKNNKNNAWKRYFLIYILISLLCFIIYFLT